MAVAGLLLTGLLGAVVGWLVGDVQARNYAEHETFARHAALVGAAVGVIHGLLVAAGLFPRGRCKHSAPPVLRD